MFWCGVLFTCFGFANHQKRCQTFLASSLNGKDGAPSLQALQQLGHDIESKSPWNFLLGFVKLQLYSCIPIALKQEVQLTFKFPLDYIAQNLSDVVAWHLFLLFPHWCLLLPIRRR
jgi:hypothetical protein